MINYNETEFLQIKHVLQQNRVIWEQIASIKLLLQLKRWSKCAAGNFLNFLLFLSRSYQHSMTFYNSRSFQWLWGLFSNSITFRVSLNKPVVVMAPSLFQHFEALLGQHSNPSTSRPRVFISLRYCKER